MRRNALFPASVFLFFIVLSKQTDAQPSIFTSFEVQPGAGCTVLLTWTIAAAADSVGFDIERSTDKKIWKKIDRMGLKPSHKYHILDTDPQEDYNYYRIRRTDNTFSEVKWLQINRGVDIFVWPNPAREALFVKTLFYDGTIELIDAAGKLIIEVMITDFITEISTGFLAKGIYYLRIRHGVQVYTQKFFKQ